MSIEKEELAVRCVLLPESLKDSDLDLIDDPEVYKLLHVVRRLRQSDPKTWHGDADSAEGRIMRVIRSLEVELKEAEEVKIDWKVNVAMLNSKCKRAMAPYVELTFGTRDGKESVELSLEAFRKLRKDVALRLSSA